jgi:hypothetical protein
MRKAALHLLTTAALVASAAIATPAGAVSGPGTWTKITTPSKTKTVRFLAPPAATTFVVSGKASNDVTEVNVVCIFSSATGVSFTGLAEAVPVTAGSFSTVATVPNGMPQCRLRAVPSDLDIDSDYLSSFYGPLLYDWAFLPRKDGSTVIGYQALSARGEGIAVASDAAQCGPTLIATIDVPMMQVLGGGRPACQFALGGRNVTPSGTPTGSTIKVKGHNAYLPGAVKDYLRGTLALTLTQPGETVTFHRATNGDQTITESAPLKRCSVSDLYPPTSVSCPALVNTGVTFKRVTKIVRGSFQMVVHDSFISTNGAAHPVSVQYVGTAEGVDDSGFYGAPGYMFPGQTSFHTVHHDQIFNGFGTAPKNLFIRSDIHAFEGEQAADTLALTWGRGPQKVQFSHTDVRRFFLAYSFNVPAHTPVSLGFA